MILLLRKLAAAVALNLSGIYRILNGTIHGDISEEAIRATTRILAAFEGNRHAPTLIFEFKGRRFSDHKRC